ncbi:MAG TPA: hypothetical protein VGN16_07790 [Acidobacteriaceae bacterium]|jgi:hypothetical protein
MTQPSSFRGIQGIRDIKARMGELVKFYRKFKPGVVELICSRDDYDLIARWPRAANVEGFSVTDNGIFYEGLRLTFDTGQGRYEKPATPEQVVIQ